MKDLVENLEKQRLAWSDDDSGAGLNCIVGLRCSLTSYTFFISQNE